MTHCIYCKQTAVGTFWIRPDKNNLWSLSIENDGDTEFLGSYDSAASAADDVYTQHTGCDEWDIPVRVNAPIGLDEWEQRAIG